MALAVHGAAIVGLVMLHATAVPAPVETRETEAEIDVESSQASTEGMPEATPVALPIHQGSERPALHAAVARPDVRSSDVVTETGATAPASSSAWTFSPTGRTAPPSIDLRLPPRTSSDPPVREPAPQQDESGGMAEELATRDAQLGLGKAAPIVSALRRAAVANSRLEGGAVMRLELDAAGRVRSIRIVRSWGGANAWQAVADAAAGAVLASGLAGTLVDVRVDATIVPLSREQTHPVDLCTSPDEGDCRGSMWATADLAARATRDIAVTVLRAVRPRPQ